MHGNEIQDILHPEWLKKLVTTAYQGINTTIFVSQKQAYEFPISVPLMKKVVLPNCYDKVFDEISWTQKKLKIKKNPKETFRIFLGDVESDLLSKTIPQK